MQPLERAIESLGGAKALADAIGVSANAPLMWITRGKGKAPPGRCPAIELATREAVAKGIPSAVIVTCEELAPEVPWHVLRKRRPATAAAQG